MKPPRYLLCILFALNLSGCERPSVLLFNGTGTSANDVKAIEALLEKSRIAYATASSAQLDAMSAERLRSYRLIIVPGGDFTRIGNGISNETAARLRDAVQSGVSYLGVCAGAFFAGRSPYNGLNLTSGVQFHFYSAEARGVRKAAVPIAGAGTPTLDQYWEDGPQLTGWGAVVGRYPDGTPAVVQGHPERAGSSSPESILRLRRTGVADWSSPRRRASTTPTPSRSSARGWIGGRCRTSN